MEGKGPRFFFIFCHGFKLNVPVKVRVIVISATKIVAQSQVEIGFFTHKKSIRINHIYVNVPKIDPIRVLRFVIYPFLFTIFFIKFM